MFVSSAIYLWYCEWCFFVGWKYCVGWFYCENFSWLIFFCFLSVWVLWNLGWFVLKGWYIRLSNDGLPLRNVWKLTLKSSSQLAKAMICNHQNITLHSFSVFSTFFDIVWVLLVNYLCVCCVSGFLSLFLVRPISCACGKDFNVYLRVCCYSFWGSMNILSRVCLWCHLCLILWLLCIGTRVAIWICFP